MQFQQEVQFFNLTSFAFLIGLDIDASALQWTGFDAVAVSRVLGFFQIAFSCFIVRVRTRYLAKIDLCKAFPQIAFSSLL